MVGPKKLAGGFSTSLRPRKRGRKTFFSLTGNWPSPAHFGFQNRIFFTGFPNFGRFKNIFPGVLSHNLRGAEELPVSQEDISPVATFRRISQGSTGEL